VDARPPHLSVNLPARGALGSGSGGWIPPAGPARGSCCKTSCTTPRAVRRPPYLARTHVRLTSDPLRPRVSVRSRGLPRRAPDSGLDRAPARRVALTGPTRRGAAWQRHPAGRERAYRRPSSRARPRPPPLARARRRHRGWRTPAPAAAAPSGASQPSPMASSGESPHGGWVGLASTGTRGRLCDARVAQAKRSSRQPEASRARTTRTWPSGAIATKWARSSCTPGWSSTSTSSSES
jgi:hypothetical protein